MIKELVPTEAQEQQKLCTWLTLKRIKFFSIPNGGKMSTFQGSKFKRTGTIPGIPDLMIPIPSGSYHGLFLELKRQSGGKLSNYQVEWLKFLREQAYYADVARGFDEARAIVEYYLALTPIAA